MRRVASEIGRSQSELISDRDARAEATTDEKGKENVGAKVVMFTPPAAEIVERVSLELTHPSVDDEVTSISDVAIGLGSILFASVVGEEKSDERQFGGSAMRARTPIGE